MQYQKHEKYHENSELPKDDLQHGHNWGEWFKNTDVVKGLYQGEIDDHYHNNAAGRAILRVEVLENDVEHVWKYVQEVHKVTQFREVNPSGLEHLNTFIHHRIDYTEI